MMTTFLLSYWLHSTVLLALAWCAVRVARPGSPIVRERLWKLAAVLPVLTALMASVWPDVALSLRDRKAERGSTSEAVSHSEPVDDSAVLSRSDRATEASDLISRNALASGSEFPTTLEPDASAFRLIDAVEMEVDRPINDAPQDAANVAVIAPRDEPFAVDQQTEIRDPTSQDTQVETNVTLFNNQSELPRSEDLRSDREPLAEGSSRGAVMATLDWQSFWQIVSRVLCGWMGVGFAWMLVRSVWFHSRLLKAKRVDRGRAIELLAKLSRRTPRLLIVPGFAEPAAFGLFRPTIVLPPSCESLPRDELRAVLAHELAHIARGDLWWLLIGRVLTTVLAFQPLNRVARREWTAAAECLCDAWAVDRGVERLTLARCLTALAEHRLTGVSLADALAAVGSPSSLRTRIERLVSEPAVDPWMKPSRRWLLSGSVIAAALLMGVMLPLPTVHSETGIESVPRPLGSGLAEESTGPLPDGRGTDEIVAEIEAELVALRADLARVERFAHESGDAGAIDMVERLRDRERQIIERWERHKLDTADEDKLER